MTNAPSAALFQRLETLLGTKGFTRSAGDMAPWLTDWRGRHAGAAAAMLSPASTQEVQAIVRLCAAERVAIVPQGGNTSMVAGATPDADGAAVLLSLRRMNRIRAIDAEENVARCEAGVVLAHLHAAAAERGRRFPLSLGAKGSATIGGLVSTNAGGVQVLRFGTMRSLVLGLEAVLPDGSIHDGMAALRKDNRGYDLKQLLIGAEGTLGIVTAASLRLVPAVGARCVAWAGLASPEDALALLRRMQAGMAEAIESFELLPQAALDLVLRHVPGTRAPLAGSHPWHVLLEAAAPAGAPDPAAGVAALLEEGLARGLVADAAIAASEAQAEAFWRIRESIAEAERQDGPAAKHDIAVQVPDMPRFVTAAAGEVERRFPGVRVLAFGHLGDGNIHFNVRAPAGAAPDWLEAGAPAVTAFVHDLVTHAGGTISAEHGIGQAKLAEFVRLADPARLAAMRAIKQALDPLGILNPGKLLPVPRPGQEELAEARHRP